MRLSHLFYRNNSFEKNNEQLELLELMKKSCILHQDSSGIYSTLTLGLLLQEQIEEVIKRHMESCGFSQMRLSILQDLDLWHQTGRVESYEKELFRLRDRKNRELCLSATAEELMTSIVKTHYQGSKINLNVYQIGDKYRDEIRSRGGLIRAKQFVMKDGYTYCSSAQESTDKYAEVKKAYENILTELGFSFETKLSDNGQMGGKVSEEFLIKSAYAQGSDDQDLLEVAHIFQLGQTYSEKLGLVDNNKNAVFMNCYGIGVSRLLMVWCENHRDKLGFFGNKNFSTFHTVISALDYHRNAEVRELSDKLYQSLKAKGVRVLLDDREENAGKKLVDSELMGIYQRIVISQQALTKNSFELLHRQTLEKSYLTQEALFNL